MKHLRYLPPILLIAAALAGCIPAGSPSLATATQAGPSPSLTASPTLTQTPTSTPLAATSTPPATLTPAQTEATLRTLLREPIDCAAPCFWGITPGQTSLDEAASIFAHLGLSGGPGTTVGNRPAYGTSYDFDNGLWINPVLVTEGNMVKASEITVRPEKEQAGVPRAWLAYSPETLIERYGPPSKVEFAWEKGIGTSETVYYMTMYFDAVDLVAEYKSDLEFRLSPFKACPLTDQFRFVDLWMAEGPHDPPDWRTPLETATPMTMDELAALLTGDPSNACIELKK
jgi:hypothetical protein